jgi:hypothetical protein
MLGHSAKKIDFFVDNCEDGLFTFEKVTGHFLRTAKQEAIDLQAAAPGVTLQCVEKCRDAGADCPAFIVDHSAMRCFKLDRNTQGRGEELTRRDGQNYFEKICLRGNNNIAFARRIPECLVM